MSEPPVRAYSRYTRKATELMGSMIRLHRIERKMTIKDLADRAGISRTTLQKIEQGNLKCEIGLVFEVAALVGMRLFDADMVSLGPLEERVADKIALLPKKVHPLKQDVDDAF